jgi:serine phosphatase RsbU (regulator of sigma subunit)/HAMP domain-containing protein
MMDTLPDEVATGGCMLRGFRGLRARLLVIVLLALLPATVLLVAYAGYQNQSSELRAAQDVQRLAESDASSLQGLVGQARATLVAYSASQAVQNQQWKIAQATAQRIEGEHPEYLNIGVLATDGRLVVSALPTSGTVTARDRTYFQRAMKYRRFAVGDYQVGRVSGKPSITVAYPVLDAAGSVRAVTYVSLDVRRMRSLISATAKSSPFREYLIDSVGNVVLRAPDGSIGEGASLAGTPLMDAMKATSRGSISARVGGDALLQFEYRPVFVEPDGGLFLAIGFSPDELFATEDRVFVIALVGFALVTLVALLAAWTAGTNWVYKPTRKLSEAAMRIGRGKLSARAGLSTGITEFTDLGREFDAMADSIERRERFGQALAMVNRLAHSTLAFGEIMQRIISVTCDAVGAETAAIVMRENGAWCTAYSYNFPQEIIGVVLTDEQAPHAAMALKSGRPVAIDDGRADPRVNGEVLTSYGIRSVLTMPLIVQDEVIGVMFMNHHTRAVEFTSAQIDFAASVAATVALALHNARLYEGEHRIAETLQKSLLALPETLPRVRFAHVYRSATEAARVGGDFYDLFEIEHGLIGITCGDVSGKGLDAAAQTSVVKNAIRAQATDAGKTPAEAMAAANRLLLRESGPEMFATVFFAVLDTATGRIVYCNAGHTSGVIVRPGSPAVLLEANSTIVGAFPDSVFADSEAFMETEDLLFLYTDGLTEARGADGLFGEERLVTLLEELQSSEPWSAATHVIQEAGDFAGGHLSDDLAIIAVALTDR